MSGSIDTNGAPRATNASTTFNVAEAKTQADARFVSDYVGKTLAKHGMLGGTIRMTSIFEGYAGRPDYAFKRALEHARTNQRSVVVLTRLEHMQDTLQTIVPSSPTVARRTDWIVDVESGWGKPVVMKAGQALTSVGITMAIVNPDGSSQFVSASPVPFSMALGPQTWLAAARRAAIEPAKPIKLR